MKTLVVLIIALIALSAADEASSPLWLRGRWREDSARTKEEGMRLLDEPIDQNQSQKEIWSAAVKRANLRADLKTYGDGFPIDFIVTAHDETTLGHYIQETDKLTVTKVSRDQCTLQIAKGGPETFYRAGDEIFTRSGTSDLKIYYRRIL